MANMTKADDMRNTLDKLRPQIGAALPSHIPADRFIRIAMTSWNMTPALHEAERSSLLGAWMKCAQDGLLPDGREAAIVLFRDKKAGGKTAQYMPMVAGILKKIRNSGELQSIATQVVHEADVRDGKFRYWVDEDGEHIRHEPDMLSDRGKPVGAYAMAKTKDGGLYIEVMKKDQIMSVKDVSRSKEFGPWSGPFELEMWRKTALKRLSKRLPMSTDVDELLKRDDEDVDFALAASPETPVLPEQTEAPTNGGKPKMKRLNAAIQSSVIDTEYSEETPPLPEVPPEADEPPPAEEI